MNPSFIVTFITGALLVYVTEQYNENGFNKVFISIYDGNFSYVLRKSKKRL